MSSDSLVGGVPLVGGDSSVTSLEDTVNILAAAKNNSDDVRTDNPRTEGDDVAAEQLGDLTAEGEKNPLLRNVTYKFAEAEVNAAIRGRLSAAAKTTRINGFRPGKVPINVMQSRAGEQVLMDVLGEKAGEKFGQEAASFAEGEQPAAAPRMVRSPTSLPGEYQVDCSYEVMPSVAAPNLDGHELRRPLLTVGEKEIDEMVERLRQNKKEHLEVSRAATKQDIVRVDCIVKRGDEIVEDVKDRPWQLDSPMLADEVVQALIGASAGDSRTVKHTVPQAHPDTKMRDAELDMAITVRAVLTANLPELNDEFFASFGVKEGGITAFRKMVSAHLETEVKNRISAGVRNRVMNVLLQATPPFPLPQVLLMREASAIMHRMEADLEARGLPKSLAEVTEESAPRLYGQAMRHVTLGLIINAWREREKISVSEEDMSVRLNELSQDYEDPDEFKRRARTDEQSMYSLHLSLLEDKVAEWVTERVKVVDAQVTLSQLLDGGGLDEEAEQSVREFTQEPAQTLTQAGADSADVNQQKT